MSPAAKLDFAATFADDGALAGASAEVLRSVQHLLRVMPAVGLQFSSLVVVPAAGQHYRIDFQPLSQLGCSVSEDCNLEILKSPFGDIAWSLKY